ncbi:preprotein translocase subunit SecA [Bdellovibrio bacteriovorus]|uniref:Protein translocase subunit SecA n=1 Tax=Bdellovibrio bacteriovorus (strain ATCC 15356 / DSM 50701 / NCIMB 9529 / HD100) TaxID=264462 RepID=SECA_BDEBA|nr:preprotein translocase subunit SecA [Bdellovibrio bacteriovorus]Q6MR29.1 RecName: Full=Protein translocase subunit SecA [Bdellovibrio bacteriovorus HD100]AHZ85904.1 preprotein translocase subunit SecA [Bdellovibrio bacteriovorus]BEV66825.1 Protein translocase subunit SecA [Bdellovibrio bacteriovorus]CAE77929.1 preprotein translocase SecA subunit [Bdellovibrio bacteriovorus HD100]
MVTQILTKMFGTKHDREMKKIQPTVDRINALEPQMAALTDDQLKAKTPEFQERLKKGETVHDILPEAFAVCREASKRVLGMRHYDVQLIGGYVLNRGNIAEMRTGEGKTLVATLPVYLNALTGRGVHVVTVNDYLVRRDAEHMGRLYGWLGLTTGIIVHGLTDQQRKQMYACDITYCTNNELGFDYLRDNMKFDLNDYVQRPHYYAIVDECDSILVDEARTPLIISGPAESSTDKYYAVNQIIPHLKRDVHFTMEEKSKTASLTDAGNAKVEELMGLSNLYDPQNIEILHHVYQGLKAHYLYRLDVEYMIKDGEIVIVDEFTGRLMPGRRWSDGLHQAIEAKEGVEVKSENQTLATITFQNYFRMYEKLSGMTGTADTEAVEFKKIYNLEVNVIPTNRPIQRKDQEDVVYKSEKAKFKAITADIKERMAKGQPILVGTESIEKSEALSAFLRKEGVKHEVLNAKHHEREAEIIAQAGRKGAVTIATNMAGRGTDIMLGGNADMLAKAQVGNDDSPEFAEAVQKIKPQVEAERAEVRSVGGLYIIGTERHESRRIDNQLRGRSGRQGDPGESRFYLSLEDKLMRIFNGERIQKIMEMLNIPEDEPITAKMVTNAIEGAQRKVEGHNFDIRKNLMEYDSVMNAQRNAIYGMRRKVLEGQEIERTTLDWLGDVVSNLLDTHIPEGGKKEEWSLEGLNNSLAQSFGFKIDFATMAVNTETVTDAVKSGVKEVWERQKNSMGPFFEQVQKMILLQSIDHHWKNHLYVIDKLKEGISLRGYAQKDPLIEYKKEAFKAFETLNNTIKSDAIEKVMRVQLVAQQNEQEVLESLRPEEADLDELDYSSPSEADIGHSIPETSEDAPKRKMTFQSGPRDDRPMNREERRRMDKDTKGKR